MKKSITLLLLAGLAFFLQSATPAANVEKTTEKKVTYVNVYTSTGNPTSDLIVVHLWNATYNYYYYVPAGTAAGTVVGQAADGCNYNVTLTSYGAPHNLGFYYWQAYNVTSATWTYGMCFTNCTTCAQIRIS